MTTLPQPLPAVEPDAVHAIADHMDTVFRSMLAVEGSLTTPACFRSITGEPHPIGNLALFSRDASADEIAEHARPLAEAPLPTAILFLNNGTPEQIRAAESLGFVHGESMPAMSVTPDTLADTSPPNRSATRGPRATPRACSRHPRWAPPSTPESASASTASWNSWCASPSKRSRPDQRPITARSTARPARGCTPQSTR